MLEDEGMIGKQVFYTCIQQSLLIGCVYMYCIWQSMYSFLWWAIEYADRASRYIPTVGMRTRGPVDSLEFVRT